jgi:hypothetical protein
MKKHFIKYILGVAAVTAMTASGCKKDFFNRPPQAATTVGNYYQTVDQVNASTDILYGSPWFGWNNKVGWAITENGGGNLRSWSSDVSAFESLAVPNTNSELLAAWDSPFTVIAQANGIINNLPANVPASVSKAAVNNALGEARMMRAVAYFFLVRTFGAVPIVENPLDDVNKFQSIPRNTVPDVYKFIVNDLQFAEANCYAGTAHTGHGSSNSASALLSKVYLYMQDYADAQKEAEKVIASNEFALLPNFHDLFLSANNNNKESILAMQWISGGGYDYGNSIQASWAFSSTITGTGDGYGTVGPTFDLQDDFKKEGGDSTRRHETYMIPGSYYAEIDQAAGGYRLPLSASSQGTFAEAKKYIVGTPADNNGVGNAQATHNNTYIMRYADVLLIEAEAIMGQQANPGVGHGIDTSTVTSDPKAVMYFNMVRSRAHVPTVTSFTYRDLMRERRIEFALEQDYFFDLMRYDGFNVSHHPLALSIMNKQDRGSAGGTWPNVQRYHNETYTFTDANLVWPIPASETSSDPALLKDPVPYTFK